MGDLEGQTKASGWDPVGDGAPRRVWDRLTPAPQKPSLQQCRLGGLVDRAKRPPPERKPPPEEGHRAMFPACGPSMPACSQTHHTHAGQSAAWVALSVLLSQKVGAVEVT